MASIKLPENSVVESQLADSPIQAAVLPYWPLWAAAQFASTDPAKELLNFIHVHKVTEGASTYIQIESTDGHRAFRYRLPTVDTSFIPTFWSVPDGGLMLLAKPLKKAQSYAKLVTVSDDLRVTFHGGKKAAVDEIGSLKIESFYGISSASHAAHYTFPAINQLWPDSFNNEPKKTFAFNACYLKEWFSVVDKLSTNGISRVDCNAPTTPFVFRCRYEPRIGTHGSDAMLELLLMPVQIRN